MARLPKNVVKRGKGYVFRARVNGKHVRVALGSDLTEARRRATILRHPTGQSDEIPSVSDGNSTLAVFAERWLTEYVGQRRVGKGPDLARQRLKDYVLAVIGHLEPSEVRTPHLRQVRARGEAAGLGAQSVRHVLADVRCLLRYAQECELTDRVPSFRQVMPPIPEMAPRRLPDALVTEILEAVPERHRFVILLALETGLRWGEIRRLQWRHVVWNPEPHLVVEETKSRKVRRVPLSPVAERLLREERKGTSSVFVSPLRMKNPCSIAYRCKVKGWTFHQLRHTFATRWLEAGGSKEALQRLLGHSTILLTERYGKLGDQAVFSEWIRVRGGHKGGHKAVDQGRKSL